MQKVVTLMVLCFPLFVTHVAPDRVRQDPAQPREEGVRVALPRDFIEVHSSRSKTEHKIFLPKATLEKAHSKEIKANMTKKLSNTVQKVYVDCYVMLLLMSQFRS